MVRAGAGVVPDGRRGVDGPDFLGLIGIGSRRGGQTTIRDRGALWLAATHAGQTALEAALRRGRSGRGLRHERADRCLRDARTAVPHICTQEINSEVTGRLASGRVDATMASHGSWTTGARA